MVSEVIWPFTIPAKIMAPKSRIQGNVEALIDSGCTSCLISLQTVLKLGIRVNPLTYKISASHKSLIGGAPTTLLTEPVMLEIGRHWEIIRFVVAPKITKAVILGLSWLDKLPPTIWWEGGERKLRLGIGLLLPPSAPK